MRPLGRFAVGLAVFWAEEAFDAYDWLTGRSRDAELRRFMAEHPGVIIHQLDPKETPKWL